MEKGWVKSYRSKWTHPVFRNLLEAGIWSWICETAAWEDCRVRVNGHVFSLKRGQLVTTRRFISQGFGIGEQVTRTFLENLEKEGMVNLQTNQQATIITVCNYDEYQCFENTTNPQVNQPLTSPQPAANPNNKELKNKRTKEGREREARDASPSPKGLSFRNWLEEIKKTDPEVSGELCPDLLCDEAERIGLQHNAIDQWSVFHDHWMAQTGQKAVKADWVATWRNWLRRDFGHGKR